MAAEMMGVRRDALGEARRMSTSEENVRRYGTAASSKVSLRDLSSSTLSS
jgi:hypothetical protein